MKKRLFAALLLMTLIVSLFSGCGKNTGASGNGDGKETYTIQLAHVEPEDRSVHKGSVAFKEYVEEKSGGRVTVNILPNGQFGGDRQAVEGVALGTIQMAAAVTAVLTSYNEDFMVLDLPFIFNNREASYAALDGELGEALNDTLPQYGLIGLGFNDNGLRQMTNDVRPINEPADMKGIKFRVMESPVFIDMMKLLGANPTPMSFSEVYTALQQGTVDGQENPAALIYASKFQEVQKYLSLTNHVYSMNAIVINKSFYEGLPEDLQKIVADGAKECLVGKQREIEGNNDAESIQKLGEAGMQVNEITPENLQKFKDAIAPMIDKYKKTIRPELFDMIDKANEANK